ncbi:MAG: hypothetical protein DMG30_14355 [Acidobacteria bacterium]|nr:MAG: hypothetical protein DMG30_14355 [Acidobacteriota bacterium]PYY03899.1 MAG: hypothetical protein DMG69_31695 [Acidobacteriota bacterium]
MAQGGGHFTDSTRVICKWICAAANSSRESGCPRDRRYWRLHYRKVGTGRAQAISKVCFAGSARIENGRIADIRLAFGSVAPVVLRAIETERLLRSEKISPGVGRAAREKLAQEIAPIDDERSTAHYRRHVAQNLLTEFMELLSSD